jgi:predicted phage baseplate assembly protein
VSTGDGCGCGCCGGGGCGGQGGGAGGPGGPCGGPSGCGCCQGVQALIPTVIVNRPGLSQIAYRVGTHGSFLATMEAALSGAAEPLLRALRVRTADDPSIAFLDCWATVGDVLTFYTERIANEGYLRTATELRSVLELARLTGYRLRPGLGASVYLSYTLQVNPAKVTSVVIGKGARAMSVPGPGQQAQAYETTDDLYAQQTWNTLPIRATTPGTVIAGQLAVKPPPPPSVSLQGATLAIHPGDRMVFSDAADARVPMSVQTVDADATANVTTVTLAADPLRAAAGSSVRAAAVPGAPAKDGEPLPNLRGLITPLQLPPSVPPPDSAHLARTVTSVFRAGSDVAPQLLVGLAPRLGPGLYDAWGQTTTPPPDTALPDVAVQRVKAGVFGATAPLEPVTDASGVVKGTREWPLNGSFTARIDVVADATDPGLNPPTITVSVVDPVGQTGSTSFVAINYPTATVPLTTGPDAVSVAIAPPVTIDTGGVQAQVAVVAPVDLVFTFSGGMTASPEIFSHNALGDPKVTIDSTDYYPIAGQLIQNSGQSGGQVISLIAPTGAQARLMVTIDTWAPPAHLDVIDLDASYDQVVTGSWAVIERADLPVADPLHVVTAQVTGVATIARSDYGLSGKATRLTLDRPWLSGADVRLSVARNTTVFVQSDPQTLARVADPIPVSGTSFDLDGIYGGLPTGRWLIITGERTDLPGVTTGEVVMVAGTTQGADLAGDTVHTTVQLSTALAYCYVRSTVTIYGNVVAATQGATQQDVLGSGAASQAGQSFQVSRSPLTYLPAPTAAGAASTLVTSVNAVAWQEVGNLVFAGPADHVYMTRTDAAGKTTVLFGDGVHGARLPTGAANVTAAYRVGLGAAGNAQPNQISQPQTKPQGVQGVTNPLPASGGADPDTVQAARANAPLPLMALDRVVSVQDYQDFARAWAGIGKASSVLLSDRLSQFVHLTIGGTTDQPVETSSALVANLVASLAANGDPHLPVRVAPCQITLIVLAAGVHIQPGYQWTDVSAAVRTALQAAYSYDNRSLGQAVVLSDIVATIQAVPGVDYAIVTALTVMALTDPDTTVTALANLATTLSAQPQPSIPVPLATAVPRVDANGKQLPPPWVINPAQVAIVTPDVPDSLVLTQITP